MVDTIASLPLTESIEVQSSDDVASAIRGARDRGSAVYPIGGGTSLDFGLPAQVDGTGVLLRGMSRIVDYPVRDMTITAEAGVTMGELSAALAAEGQQFPVDAPHSDQATLGGVVATNFNGPRRYGMGAVRDYVIGVSAVDGRGVEFKGGGRVVKNVAGYDFCKLLTGSMGTLAVITQVTLKVRPLNPSRGIVSAAVEKWEDAEQALACLSKTLTTPVAVEAYNGSAIESLDLAVGAGGVAALFEGSAAEVDWQVRQLQSEWRSVGLAPVEGDETLASDALRLWTEFPAVEAPLVLKATVRPSGVTRFVDAALEIDPGAAVLSHAGSGIVFVRFSEFPAEGLSRTLVARLQPTAARADGAIVVLSNRSGVESTRRSVWGETHAPYDLMTDVKRQFDPHCVLNPRRFVYNDYAPAF
ncbi:MAG: FAD-binding oxidoreductase [Pirellulaceae bacterium]|jgi:glycolate oxidase FAD binding subunit|nr:FAD-binding oxidoreductase [Pirellulaceae bacterium]MDP7017008.1 FAD-binding oxidoreductase [Pirellulaceae bacterium]